MATVEVDQDLCIADQVCASMHPDIYEMGDDGFAHVVDGMEELDDEGDIDRAIEAAEACPVDAIIVEE
jgi:ferredoxin